MKRAGAMTVAGLTATLLGVALGGCASSPASRASEKAEIFGRLTARQQENVRDGLIEGGYTADMVYIALGRPSETTPAYDGRGELWTYRNFYPSRRWAGQSLYRRAGTSEAVVTGSIRGAMGAVGDVRDPNAGGGYGEGVSRAGTPDSDVTSATLRVWFQNGRVVRFELQP